jgi:hypothetical protein
MILVSAQFHRWIRSCGRIRKSEAGDKGPNPKILGRTFTLGRTPQGCIKLQYSPRVGIAEVSNLPAPLRFLQAADWKSAIQQSGTLRYFPGHSCTQQANGDAVERVLTVARTKIAQTFAARGNPVPLRSLTVCRLEVGDTAEWNSALLPCARLDWA